MEGSVQVDYDDPSRRSRRLRACEPPSPIGPTTTSSSAEVQEHKGDGPPPAGGSRQTGRHWLPVAATIYNQIALLKIPFRGILV